MTIALEPEAASMYCKRLPIEMLNDNLRVQNEGFQFFSQGNQYLVLDAGGMHYIHIKLAKSELYASVKIFLSDNY